MIVCRLDEILPTVLLGLPCRAEDFDEIGDVGVELLDWLGRVSPFEQGVAPAQTLKRMLSRRNARRARPSEHREQPATSALDATFREDQRRARKDHSARNRATIRRAALDMLRRQPSKISLKRNRPKALMNPAFGKAVLAW